MTTLISVNIVAALVVVFLMIATPTAVAAFCLRNFNAHVKDKRIRERAITAAKYIDKVFPNESDQGKMARLVATLIEGFGVDPMRARQVGEAAVFDIHSGVHAIATAPLEPQTLLTPVHVIVNTPSADAAVVESAVKSAVSDAISGLVSSAVPTPPDLPPDAPPVVPVVSPTA